MNFDILQKPPPEDDTRGWYRWFYRVCELLNNAWPIRFGEKPNYSQFDEDGTLVAYGDATTWDDVYPSSITVGVGGTAPSFTAYNGGNLKAYEFTGGVSDKQLHIGYQIYHSSKLSHRIAADHFTPLPIIILQIALKRGFVKFSVLSLNTISCGLYLAMYRSISSSTE